MKYSILTTILLLIGSIHYGMTYTSVAHGYWSASSIWDTGVSPGFNSGDTIIISHAVYLNQDFDSQSGCYILINAGAGICGHQVMTLNSSKLDNYGTLELDKINVLGSLVYTYPNSESILTQQVHITGPTPAGWYNNGYLAVGPWFDCSLPEYGVVSDVLENEDLNEVKFIQRGDQLCYYSSQLEKVMRITVYDSFGRQMQNTSAINGVLNLGTHSTGIYFIVFVTEKGIITKKQFLE